MMSILVSSNTEDNLAQGDLLKGIKLFSTNVESGDAELLPCQYAMIISRPCNVSNKKHLVVAPVLKLKEPTNDIDFDSILKTLNAFRDGLASPDRFYLGHLPSERGRFSAHLDTMSSIANSDALKAKRVAKLSGNFVSDLSIRFFSAFSKQGFDDHAWFSTPDLQWLVT